ncbi:ATP-dependent DNA helicase [Frankliniella fusca]|uniref:ATP-dependent DNA helicase n=1 Tax=Frankliniella fusca TaxID=407009 RepID=A0AAE1LFQ1_9NEOP|nr:ATP-dependent DNA helicase [Frankliniella fusca]
MESDEFVYPDDFVRNSISRKIKLRNGLEFVLSDEQYHNILNQVNDVKENKNRCCQSVDVPSTSLGITEESLTPFRETLMSYEVDITDGFKMVLSDEEFTELFLCHDDVSFEEQDEAEKDVVIDDEPNKEKTKPDEDPKKSESKKADDENDKKKDDGEKKEKLKRKRKSEKGSDTDTSTRKKSKSKRKSKPTDDKKTDKTETSSDEDSSDDEEINRLNKAASKIPTYKSIKNLVRKRFYKVLDISDDETTKGRTIRLKLEDGDADDVKQKRKKDRERQRKYRKNLDKEKQKKINEKARVSMRKLRERKTDREKEIERKRNSERRYLTRQLKKSGLQYNFNEGLDVDQHNFNIYMKSLSWQECPHCHRRVVQSCFNTFRCHKNCHLFTEENDMDPGEVPKELQDLTYIEKQLIARVHSVISLYKFKKCPYKYRGQVINFSQDVQSVADKLPHLVSDLNNLVVVKLTQSVTVHDFFVRKGKVLDALVWLKDHNPSYSDIIIDYENLDTLPTDGCVYSDLKHSVNFHNDDDVGDDFENEDDSDLVFTHVPDVLNSSLKKSFNNFLIWPSLGTTPINEFSSPSYISMCFPHLFPYGKADYTVARPHKVQRHTKCSKSHCLRPIGKSNTLECRYRFPRDMVSETEFEINDKGDIVDIKFKRNDPLIVYRYIAKYASKSEVKSISYNELLTEILNTSSDDADMSKKAIRKLLISSCGERDYCAQEVMHFLMGFHFYHSSREFVVINLKNLDWAIINNGLSSTNILDLYAKRPSHLEKLSLYEIGRFIRFVSGKPVWRSKEAVVRFFPKCVREHNVDLFYLYMSQIFYPWRSIDDLIPLNDDMIQNIDNSYRKYVIPHSESDFHHGNQDDKDDYSIDMKEAPEKDNEGILSSYNPNKQGNRGNDKSFHDNDYEKDYMCHKVSTETVQILYEKLRTDYESKEEIFINSHSLSYDQKSVFNFVKELSEKLKSKAVDEGQFAIVQGMPGTGKTYLLKCCVNYIKKNFDSRAVKVIAPTGVSAKLINGTTLHSFLCLGRSGYYCDGLSGLELVNYREKHKGIRFLFVDEYSMLGLRMLSCLEKRCRDLTDCDQLFGNLIVILFGDVNQLLPVCDQPLYADINILSQYNQLLEKGKLIMSQLSRAFVLKLCHRFANKQYVSFLKKVLRGSCTLKEMNFMKDRCLNAMSTSERLKFKNSLRVCSTNDNSHSYNMKKLRSLCKPIAILQAVNNNKTAFLSSDDLADGLVNVLSICKGAKVMLRKNINVSRGLVNGAIGVIKHIVFEKGKKPPLLPLCILVKFETVTLSDLNIQYVPIIPVVSTWYRTGVLYVGASEFALGLLYVALSRVPDKNSLCLAGIFINKETCCCAEKHEMQSKQKNQRKSLYNHKLYMRKYRQRLSEKRIQQVREKDRLYRQKKRKLMNRKSH